MLFKRRKQIYVPTEHFGKQVLRNRGIKDVDSYVNVDESALLPLDLIDNIDEGAELLIDHIQNNSSIFVLPDADQDGMASAAIIWNYIKDINPDAKLFYKMHKTKKHGLSESYLNPSYDLYIVPDAGSSEYDIHKKVKEMGSDIIVIDHHHAEKYSEDAIVINNQLSKRYPNKDLSGSGMCLKFCQSVDEKLGTDYAENYYDLAAVGIVGDVMSLRNPETRYIVKRGLENINNPALKAIINSNAYMIGEGPITPKDVSFSIAPVTNAVVRSGTEADREFMFQAYTNGNTEVQDTKRGAKDGQLETYANQFARLGGNARTRQNNEKEAFVEKIREQVDDCPVIIVTPEEEINPSITGLVAGQISPEYGRPTLVLGKRAGEENKDFYFGSGRNEPRPGFPDFRKFLEDSGLVEYASGHANAFGVKIKKSKVQALKEYAEKHLVDIRFGSEEHVVDVVLPADSTVLPFCVETIDEYKSVWGKGVEEPKLLIEDVSLLREEIQVIGKRADTVKFSHNGVEYIKFKAKDEIEEFTKNGSMSITLVGKASMNEWAGKKTPQIKIEDYSIRDTTYEF